MRKNEEKNLPEVPKTGTAMALPGSVDLLADAGQGFEKADREAYAIPFLTILQKMSPQVDEAAGEFIDGAKPGMLLNTVTGELFDGKAGVRVVPVHYDRVLLEFVTRDDGGGFKGAHDPATGMLSTCKRDDKGRDILPNGHQLVDTRQHYALLVKGDGGYEPVIVAMASTQTKKSRQWMTRMQNVKVEHEGRMFTPAMFARSYLLQTQVESNDKGSWHGWRIGDSEPVTASLYEAAKAFRASVASGAAKAAHETLTPKAGSDVPGDLDDDSGM